MFSLRTAFIATIAARAASQAEKASQPMVLDRMAIGACQFLSSSNDAEFCTKHVETAGTHNMYAPSEVSPVQSGFLIVNACLLLLSLMGLYGLIRARRSQVVAQAENRSLMQALPNVLAFISLGASLIYLNKYLFLGTQQGGYGFSHPMALCFLQMLFGCIMTRGLSFFKESMKTTIASGVFTWSRWACTIVPLGLALSGSLAFSNTAYLYLPVSFVQMLKASGPVIVYLLTCSVGMDTWSTPTLIVLLSITCGIAGTAAGEGGFNAFGFSMQICGLLCDAAKLALTKVLMSSQGCALEPMMALYYFAPVCCLSLGTGAFFIEGMPPMSLVIHLWPILLLNAVLAFSLQIASVALMKATSATTYSLSSVVRDVGVIFSAAAIFNTPLTTVQVVGYSVAVVGVQMFTVIKEDNNSWYNMLANYGIGKPVGSDEETTPLKAAKV